MLKIFNLIKFNTVGHYLLLLLLIFFLFHLLIILLDGIYRPNISQYPANKFLDILLPLIFILSPLLIPFYPMFIIFDISDLDKLEILFLIICIYCIIIIPIIYLWSKHRNWDTILIKNKWTHPHVYLHITISLLYPLIWLIYFNLIKYLRLGNSLDLTYILDRKWVEVFILIIFLWPFISIWIRLLLWNFIYIRYLLWKELMILINSINIVLLKFKIYFKFMEILYKISFLFVSYVSMDGLLYPNPSFLQNIVRKLYFYPIIINILAITIIFIELLYTKGFLFYSLYILLFITIMRSIIYFFSTFNGPSNTWIKMCCFSNYRYLKWDNPYYPINFWLFFYDIREDHNNLPKITEKEELQIKTNIEHFTRVNRKTKDYNLYRLQKYYSKKSTGYKNRLKLSYNQWTQIRWMHTQTFQAVNKWHPLTAYFARNIFDKFALINNDWNFYHTIEQLESKKKCLTNYTELNIYSTFNFPLPNHGIKISTIVENNLITNFKVLRTEYDIKITTFDNNINLDSKSQSKPDAIFDFRNARVLQDKRVHGMDQKSTKNISEPTSKIYSQISPLLYEQALENFFQEFRYNAKLSTNTIIQVRSILNNLAKSSENINDHQKIWAKNLHFFPNEYIPPIRTPFNIATNDFTLEANTMFKHCSIYMKKTSDYFTFHRIGENDLKGAIEIFNESIIQKMLNDN